MELEIERCKNLCSQQNVKFVSAEIRTVGVTQKRNKRYINFICPKHEKFGIQTKQDFDFIRLKNICSYCNHSKRKETFRDEMQKLSPSVLILSDYVGWDEYVDCKCRLCGNVWSASANSLLQGHCCPVCGKKQAQELRKYSTQEFQQMVSQKFPNIQIIGEYIGTHEYVKCKCSLDGCEWESYACNILNGSAQCPACNRVTSKGERAVMQFLDENNIKYFREYKFDGCKNVMDLRFDFYCYEINTAIEYQGQQHYYPVNFDGRDWENVLVEYQKQQNRDNIKREYCKSNNIKLIELPYWEYSNIPNFLSKVI